MEFEKSTFTGISDSKTSPAFEMSECYPNPTISTVALNVNLVKNSTIIYNVTNITGQVVKEFPAAPMNVGENLITIDVSELLAGIYFCTVDDGNHKVTKKFVVK